MNVGEKRRKINPELREKKTNKQRMKGKQRQKKRKKKER